VDNMRRAFLVGARIYLRVLDEDDISEESIGWLNDPEVTRYLAITGKFPATAKSMERWLEKRQNGTDNLAFAIMDKATNRHIGNVTLDDINWVHRTADISLIIGAKDFWGNGYGSEAQSVLIEYAFNRLGLNKVLNSPVADHIGSVKMAEKLGFQAEGVLRKQLFIEGEYRDQIRMGLFVNEFRKFVLKE
jgi:ribosomal-protein-alanine N-acetyltransferase